MTQSKGEVIALDVVFTLLAVCFIGFRLCARRVKMQALGTDDILIILATVDIPGTELQCALVTDCFQVFYILCLAIPILIRRTLFLFIFKLPDMISRLIIRHIECVDANLGNHVQTTFNGTPVTPSYLFNVVSIYFFPQVYYERNVLISAI